MSGGTLIALAADEIVMDPNAVLGPVDPQLGQSPAASVLTVLERKKPEDIDDQTLILADVSRKAITQVRRTVQHLLAERMPPKQAAALAEKLATGTWTHDYPIMAEEAKTLGLPVSTDMPPEVYQFMSLFPSRRARARRSSTCRCPTARIRASETIGRPEMAPLPTFVGRRGLGALLDLAWRSGVRAWPSRSPRRRANTGILDVVPSPGRTPRGGHVEHRLLPHARCRAGADDPIQDSLPVELDTRRAYRLERLNRW